MSLNLLSSVAELVTGSSSLTSPFLSSSHGFALGVGSEKRRFSSRLLTSSPFFSLWEKALSLRGLFRLCVFVSLLSVSMLSVASLPSYETFRVFSSLAFVGLCFPSKHSTSSSKSCDLRVEVHSLSFLRMSSLLVLPLTASACVTPLVLSLLQTPCLKQSKLLEDLGGTPLGRFKSWLPFCLCTGLLRWCQLLGRLMVLGLLLFALSGGTGEWLYLCTDTGLRFGTSSVDPTFMVARSCKSSSTETALSFPWQDVLSVSAKATAV